jgi:hypothetical protein
MIINLMIIIKNYFKSLADNLNPIIYKDKQIIVMIKHRIIGSIKHNSFDCVENISKVLTILLLFIYIFYTYIKY